MNKILISLCLFIALVNCTPQKDASLCLLQSFVPEKSQESSMDDPFFEKRKHIYLETNDSCLIGRVNKIVKSEGNYYILSDDKTIDMFDSEGSFVSRLNKKGGGPGEYAYIGDFTIVNVCGESEIWLCDFDQIKRYKLDSINRKWDFTSELYLDVVINKFSVIDTGKVLLMTGREEESLMFLDMNTKEKKTFLDKEIPFLTFKSVQFARYDSLLLYPLGQANGLVSCSPESFEFKKMTYFDDRKFLSEEGLLNLFEEYEYDFLGKIANYSYIRNISKSGNRIILDTFSEGYRIFYFTDDNKEWKYIKCNAGNDVEPNPLFTIGMSVSPDSFILFDYNHDAEENNPYLIEF